jgi:hypothetical protein
MPSAGPNSWSSRAAIVASFGLIGG